MLTFINAKRYSLDMDKMHEICSDMIDSMNIICTETGRMARPHIGMTNKVRANQIIRYWNDLVKQLNAGIKQLKKVD